MTNDPTSSFYDDNAVIYATRKRNLPQSRLDAFLAALPAGAPSSSLAAAQDRTRPI